MESLTRNVVSIRSCDIILGDFSHNLLVLHAMFRMRMGHYIGIPTSRSAPTADAVATGESSYYSFVVRLRSIPGCYRDDQPEIL